MQRDAPAFLGAPVDRKERTALRERLKYSIVPAAWIMPCDGILLCIAIDRAGRPRSSLAARSEFVDESLAWHPKGMMVGQCDERPRRPRPSNELAPALARRALDSDPREPKPPETIKLPIREC